MFVLSEKMIREVGLAWAIVVCLSLMPTGFGLRSRRAEYNGTHSQTNAQNLSITCNDAYAMNVSTTLNDIYASVRKRYVLFDERVTFFEAWRRCQSHGFRLATINSEAEGRMIAASINASSSQGDWFIGGTDLGHQGVFMWISTNIPVGHETGYYNFYPGEPNNEGGVERCLEIIRGGGVSWNDVPCDTVQEFICETDFPFV